MMSPRGKSIVGCVGDIVDGEKDGKWDGDTVGAVVSVSVGTLVLLSLMVSVSFDPVSTAPAKTIVSHDSRIVRYNRLDSAMVE